MPMEIEYFPVDSEELGEVGAEVSAADLIDGRGEPKVEISGTVGEDGIVIEQSPSLVENEAESVGEQSLAIDNESLAEKIDPDYRPRIDWGARFQAELDHESEIAGAKREHTQAALSRSAAEDAYKAAKAHEKACLNSLSALINRGPQYPDSKPKVSQGGGDSNDASSTESKIDAAVRNDKSSPSLVVDDPNADQSWREISMAPMLDNIKGMGAKKREAILALVPTLGLFEDLRGSAGIQHKPLKDVMPKGVGAAMTDEIEERALSAMRKHQLEVEKRKASQSVENQPEADQPGVEESELPVELPASTEAPDSEPVEASDSPD